MQILLPILFGAMTIPALAATPQALVRQAIADGHAEDYVEGPVADEARRKLKATGSLTLSVRRLFLYKQPDCARLQLDFTQDAALLPGSALPAPYQWSVQMNICSDGLPPTDLARRGK